MSKTLSQKAIFEDGRKAKSLMAQYCMLAQSRALKMVKFPFPAIRILSSHMFKASFRTLQGAIFLTIFLKNSSIEVRGEWDLSYLK